MTGFRNSYSHGRSLPSNNEAEYYADPAVGPNPFSVQNGALTITARPTKPGEQAGGLPYTSGMITTENSFAQNQGYFEIRAQTPSTKGFWAAFWMLPEGGAGNPELDVLEQPNNLGSSSYWSYANFGDANKGGGSNDTGQELSAGYHRYGLMWTPTAITYYFDGQQIGQSFPPPAGYASKMFLIANLAVGGAGGWPGQPVGTPTAEYKIDYIRAFSLDPAVSTVAMQAISSPDGVDTRPILTATPTPTPPGPIGSGPDTLTLNTAEDAYQGDAQTVTDTTPVILEVVAPPVVVTPPPVVVMPDPAPPVVSPPATPPVEPPVIAEPSAPPVLGLPAAPPAAPQVIAQPEAPPVAPPVAVVPRAPIVTPPAAVVTPPAPVPAVDNFTVANITAGTIAGSTGAAADGRNGIARTLISGSDDSLVVTSRIPNVFIRTGDGNDAISTWEGGGTNVLDGGEGSNFLTGCAGADTFFLDARGANAAIWSTVRNLGAGDRATVWGVTKRDMALIWTNGQGAAGAEGLTLHTMEHGDKAWASMTFSGYGTNDLTNGRLAMSFGCNDGGEYMHVRAA